MEGAAWKRAGGEGTREEGAPGEGARGKWARGQRLQIQTPGNPGGWDPTEPRGIEVCNQGQLLVPLREIIVGSFLGADGARGLCPPCLPCRPPGCVAGPSSSVISKAVKLVRNLCCEMFMAIVVT